MGTRLHDASLQDSGTPSFKFYMGVPSTVPGTAYHIIPEVYYAGRGSVGDWAIGILRYAPGSFEYAVRRQKPVAGISGTYGFFIAW